jgi:hypothetical protein
LGLWWGEDSVIWLDGAMVSVSAAQLVASKAVGSDGDLDAESVVARALEYFVHAVNPSW